ncbi:MAG: hypothetical protein MJ250_08440 [Alphaproteobacteria bacterium]|nr:hypothetical protein [Alphaproteobacteria bacterium]
MALENITIQGMITTTSNKTKENFAPRKTAFLKVAEEDKGRLITFGIPEYTSREGETFFCVKLTDSVKLWDKNGGYQTIDTTVNAPNFKTTENVMLRMNIVKGNKNHNDFYRLNAIQCEVENIETIKETNPFE